MRPVIHEVEELTVEQEEVKSIEFSIEMSNELRLTVVGQDPGDV